MKRGRSTGEPTLAEEYRFRLIKEIGCIAAHTLGLDWTYAEVHHLTLGGKHGQKRRGHAFTIGLNPWSHRGVPFGGLSAAECYDMFGPSYALQSRLFRQTFGNDDDLLAYQNRLIAEQTPFC